MKDGSFWLWSPELVLIWSVLALNLTVLCKDLIYIIWVYVI